MPPPSVPLEKLGFLTIGSFDGDDPAAGHETTLRGHRAGRAARLRQRLGAPPASAVRHLLPRRRARRGHAAHPADRAGHGGHPAGLGEPAAAGRGPRDRRHPVRGPAEPGRERRAADALRRGHATRSTRTPPTSRTSATSACCGCCGSSRGEQASPFRGTDGIEEFSDRVEPHSPGLRGRMWYGGGKPAVGAVGRRERHELPVEQRRAGRGVGGLRRDPAVAHRRRSGRTTRTAPRPASRRAWS